MALNNSVTNKSGGDEDTIPTPDRIKIHLLCPSISPTSRFTLPGRFELDSTVANLRARIQESIPTHPLPIDQRLIFRGRHLNAMSNLLTLREVLSPIDGNEYTLHLVLPPAPTSSVPAGQGPSLLSTPSIPEATVQASTAAMPANPFLSFDPAGAAPHSQPHEGQLNNLSPSPSAEFSHGIRNRFNASYPTGSSIQPSLLVGSMDASRLQYGGSNLSHSLSNTPSNLSTAPPRVYLATSPSGSQGLLMQIENSSLPNMAPIPPMNPAQIPLSGPNVAPAGVQPNEADVQNVQNVVRQAVINQQRRQNEDAGGAGRYIRRIWLFVRLYFFIYMISEPNTWARVFFVALAVLFSLLSDSGFPQQLYTMVLTPAQRHLERLTHAGGPAEEPAARPHAAIGNILDYLWRAQRSIVLLLASLIPGIGERQVQARSTAEAEAEQRRLEEERRQADEANQHPEEGHREGEPQQQEQQQEHPQEHPQAQPQDFGESHRQVPIPTSE